MAQTEVPVSAIQRVQVRWLVLAYIRVYVHVYVLLFHLKMFCFLPLVVELGPLSNVKTCNTYVHGAFFSRESACHGSRDATFQLLFGCKTFHVPVLHACGFLSNDFHDENPKAVLPGLRLERLRVCRCVDRAKKKPSLLWSKLDVRWTTSTRP